MRKDYAKHFNKPQPTWVERGWRRRLFMASLLVGLLVTVGYGFYVYKHTETILTLPWVQQAKNWGASPTVAPAPKVIIPPKQPENKIDNDIQFSFYTKLPTMQVTTDSDEPVQPNIVAKNEKVLIEKPVSSSGYLLQMAAFKNPTAASEMRISLLLDGIEVEVSKAMKDNQQLYQLQQGPFTTMAQAKAMQRLLKKKGLDSVIVKKIA